MKKTRLTGWWIGEAIAMVAVCLALAVTMSAAEHSTRLAAGFIAGLIVLIYTITLLVWTNSELGSRSDLLKQVEAQAKSNDRVATLKAVVQSMIADGDVLAEVCTWLDEYEHGQARIDDSARLHARTLDRFSRGTRLTRIGQVGSTARFDPLGHRTSDRLRPGEDVVLIEPGWRIGDDILKLPVVRRQR
jgi:hypothetical protein